MILQNLGGTYQLVIDTPGDMELISTLDEVHWMATGVTCDGFIVDQDFLKYIDADNNGRIRSDEVKAAQAWLFRMLADRSNISRECVTLKLDAIDTSHDDGKALLIAAKRVLENLGSEQRDQITLDQVRNRQHEDL